MAVVSVNREGGPARGGGGGGGGSDCHILAALWSRTTAFDYIFIGSLHYILTLYAILLFICAKGSITCRGMTGMA